MAMICQKQIPKGLKIELKLYCYLNQLRSVYKGFFADI